MLSKNEAIVDDIRNRSAQGNLIKKGIIWEVILKEYPKLADDPEKLKKEILKRIDNMTFIDSSYYLG